MMKTISPFFDTLYWALNGTWPMLTLFLVIIIIIRLYQIIINHEKIVLYKDLYFLLAIIYLLLLYYMLLSTENASSGINLIPFKEMTRYNFGSKLFYYNVIGNIVLFIPFGYFISDIIKTKGTTHILVVATIVSLTAELIQYKIGRAFDIDDIILNAVGAIIGFLCYIFIQTIKKKLPSVLQNNIFYNILAIIVVAIVILTFGSIWGII